MILVRDLGLALAIGLLIGIERGWSLRAEPDGTRVAGLRTFGLLGLGGGIAGLLGRGGGGDVGGLPGAQGQPLIAAALALAAMVVVAIGYRRSIAGNSSLSATTAIAALVTFGLGAMATLGLVVPALVAAVAATLLLSQRHALHDFLRGMNETDIQAVVRFAVIAGAIWPLLPDRAMGPYQAWNPRDLWLVVVIVCGLSFAGYVASRRFGATRGIIATAAIGGLYSSTAVTAALSQQLRDAPAESPELAPVLASGIAVASAVMFARVLVLTALLVPYALPMLALVIGPAAIVALGFVAWRWRAAHAAPAAAAAITTQNPFALLPALGFAALVAVLALIVRWAEVRYGNAGVVTLLAITGAMDVDAAIVTMRGLPAGMVAPDVAGLILALPVLLNTLVKAGVVVVTAGWKPGWRATIPLLASAAMIPLAYLLVR